MKILNNKKEEFGFQEFTCENCDSVFESEEYQIHKDPQQVGYSTWRGFRFVPSWRLCLECPVCERKTNKYIPTGEPAYWGSYG